MATLRRPIIAVPCGVYHDLWFPKAYGSPVPYLRAIEAAGGIPLLIHLTTDTEVLETHYQRCDALLLTGGDDVHPQFYGATPHPKLGPTEPLHDQVEIALTQRAVADGKPVLGICRGHQVLNVALGGTLYQDLPSDLPDGLNHNASTDQKNMSFLAHDLQLDETSWLAETLDAVELTINTLHHQAIRDLAPGLRIVGRAPDGVIEAVEGTSQNLVVGVQCHPEMLWETTDLRWSALFRRFIGSVRPN
jgi:putative glutamine amidotransferase